MGRSIFGVSISITRVNLAGFWPRHSWGGYTVQSTIGLSKPLVANEAGFAELSSLDTKAAKLKLNIRLRKSHCF